MKLYELLAVHHPEVTPGRSKVHLAVHNGWDHPIDVFRDGRFEAWQASQSKRNFSRPYVVSLIRMVGASDRWLFAGVFKPLAVRPHPKDPKPAVLYTTEAVEDKDEFVGRLVVSFKNRAKQMVRNAESIADQLIVAELRSRALSNLLFTGYYDIRLSKAELDRIVRKADPEWQGPLSSVQGIYVITDMTTGRLYVGSASASDRRGDRGIWARWKAYSQTGHGENAGLRALLAQHGAEYAKHLQFAILEVLPPHANEELVKTREGHWKRVLASFEHGYNHNKERDVVRSH